MNQPFTVLTIAGSDSGGAAGLQADLKTFTALGVYGMSAITVVTAQNSVAVNAARPLPPEFVSAQIESVLSDYGADAIKTGFIGSVPLIEAIANQLASINKPIVIDPVLVNHKGESMFDTAVTQAYLTHLFPLATLVTPNRHEAALITGVPIDTLAEGETAVRHLHKLGARQLLLKGIRHQEKSWDIHFDGQQIHHYNAPILDTHNTHGSGDTLSAAIAAFLAQGEGMETAVQHAHAFTQKAIANAQRWQLGKGHGPLNHLS
ncbi:MAG: bifunctional hydroxymethylpyrimidine kinase/phosphomethylpyrimidine kinase [Chloroflexi bacterium]|nr:bifunctional hydroxymethylpyrimidine kinase/phosphomethylpyrimidine kinase [Chloroflexota bacterium]